MYDEGKGSIYQMQTLGLDIPKEFKISAQYVLTKQFNELFIESRGFLDADIIQQASDLNFEAKRIGIEIDKKSTAKLFSHKLLQNINRLAFEIKREQYKPIWRK